MEGNVCKRCGSHNLEFVKDYPSLDHETDEEELFDGYLCKDCTCFHEISGDFFEYTFSPPEYETQFQNEDYES